MAIIDNRDTIYKSQKCLPMDIVNIISEYTGLIYVLPSGVSFTFSSIENDYDGKMTIKDIEMISDISVIKYVLNCIKLTTIHKGFQFDTITVLPEYGVYGTKENINYYFGGLLRDDFTIYTN
jgi:hypothetical protein